MNEICNTAFVAENVKLGARNRILANTVIYGPTVIGNDNIIGPNVVIGTPGQDTRNRYYDSSECEIVIGSRNIIREFTAIQKPAYEKVTTVGDDVYLMQSVHVPHDALIEDHVVVTPMCVLGGLVRVLEGANIGVGSAVHQKCVIGQYSLVAMGSVVTYNVPPFSIAIKGKPRRVNYYAIEKFKLGQYSREIESYVLHEEIPTTGLVLDIVQRFESLHSESGKRMFL
ncbi:hypothetical protein N9L83_03440 [Flavobacteriales bacterium]|nr:hypothetical protein [Flavobacteriales bacterium]